MKKVRIRKVSNGYVMLKENFFGSETYVTNNYSYLLQEVAKYFREDV